MKYTWLSDADRVTLLAGLDSLEQMNDADREYHYPEVLQNDRARRNLSAKLEQSYAPDPIDMLAVWEYYCHEPKELRKLPCESALFRRQYVVDCITPFCDHWWLYANNFLHYDDNFDWEFLPAFLGNLATHVVTDLSDEDIFAALTHVYNDNSFRRLIRGPLNHDKED